MAPRRYQVDSCEYADQLPEKEYAIPRLKKLIKLSPEKFGSKEERRENFGRYIGF